MFLVNTNQQMRVFVGKQEVTHLTLLRARLLIKITLMTRFFIGKSTPQSMCVCDTHKKEYRCCILINHIDPISSHLLFHILFTSFIMSFFLLKKK